MRSESLKSLAFSLKESKNPVLAVKRVLGKEPLHSLQDKEFVTAIFQYYPMAGAIALLPLHMREANDLPQQERIGLLCFTTLVLESDRIIDEAALLKQIRNTEELKIKLLHEQICSLNISIGELMNITMSRFPAEKQSEINIFLENMISLHAELGLAYPGNYGYTEAIMYKRVTDEMWVDVTYKLAGIHNLHAVKQMKTLGLLSQFRDDKRDWPLDWQQKSMNLYIGLANDNCELEPMSIYIVAHPIGKARTDKDYNPNDPNDPMVLPATREWMKEHTPKTFKTYKHIFIQEIANLDSVFLRWYHRRIVRRSF